MSEATKRKHVTKEVMDDFNLPDGDRLQVVRVLSSRGNNLHEVETSSGDKFLVTMPTKFRKNIWIKRHDYVMVESIDEGNKVKAEITNILYKPQIVHIRQHGLWPAEFENATDGTDKNEMIPEDMLPPSVDSDDESCDDEDKMPVCNPNRQPMQYIQDSDTDDSRDDDQTDDR